MNGLSTAARTALGGRTNAAPKVFKKHLSLNALLGTPKGAIGRSTLPMKSPYDMKNANNGNEWEDNRNAKRRKVDQPRSVTRASKEIPLWAKTSDARNAPSQNSGGIISLAGQRPLMVNEFVDLTSDNEGFSDVTIPSTPGRLPAPHSSSLEKSAVTTPGPRIPKPKVTPRREAPSSPPVSARNHLKVIDTGTIVGNTECRGTEGTVKDTLLPDTEESVPSLQRPKPAPRTKPLRIARSQPRYMLLCQTSTQTQSQPARKTQKNTNATRGIQPEAEPTLLETLIASRRPRVDPFACLSDSDDDVALSKFVPKKAQPKSKETAIPKTAAGPCNSRTAALASDGTNRSSSPAFSTMPSRPERFEPIGNFAAQASLPSPIARRGQTSSARCLGSSEMEIMHGRMDQQIFAPSNAPPPIVRMASSAFLTRNPSLPLPEPTTRAPILKPTNPAAKAPNYASSKPAVKSPFRRVQSESNAKSIIAAVSSPIEDPELVPAVLRSSQEELLRNMQTRSKKSSRKPLQRSVSLATGTKERVKVMARAQAKRIEPVPVPEKKSESGPWTIEATDLFDWRPPDWEERVQKRKAEFKY